MSKTILVGCKLPCGLIVDGLGGQNSLEINGANTAIVPGAPGLTHVDESEWLYVKTQYAEHHAFKSNAIYAHDDSDKVADVLALTDELRDEQTGFEGIDPRKPAANIKPLDDQKLDQALTQGNAPGPRKQVGGADRAAALEAAAQPKAKGKK